MVSPSRSLLVPGPWALHKSLASACCLLMATALLSACAAGRPSLERHETLHSIGLLDAGERGHFMRPNPRPVIRRRALRRPAGPASVSPSRRRRARSRSIPYVPQRHRGAARSSGSASVRAGQRIEAARAWLGTAGKAGQPFVAQVLRSAGQAIDLPRNKAYAPTLHAYLKQRGSPVTRDGAKPGDLVFFRNTLDLNGNSTPDDGVTFVAVVERVASGRVVFIGLRAGRVRRMALRLASPERIRNGAGEVVNTRLVHWPGTPAPLTAAQCFAAFARP